MPALSSRPPGSGNTRARPAAGSSHPAVSAVGGVHAPGREQAVRLLQREHLVDHRLELRVARLGLLGHARADEDAVHVVAVQLLDRERRGDHRGDDRHEAVHHLRVILAHVLGHGRARGGDVDPRRVRLQVVRVGAAHQVGALRHLHHVVEPGRLEGADDLPGGRAEARREGRRQQRGHRSVLLEQPGRPLQPAQIRLGVLGADQRAVAAGDAALVDHERLPVLDADGLRGAVAHAGVAAAAVLLDRRDDGAAHETPVRPRPCAGCGRCRCGAAGGGRPRPADGRGGPRRAPARPRSRESGGCGSACPLRRGAPAAP